MCTGLVVNNGQVTPPRSYTRRLRSLVDHWRRNGWQDAAEVLHLKEHRPLFKDRERLAGHVSGRIAYLKMVRGKNDPIAANLDQIVASLPQNH